MIVRKLLAALQNMYFAKPERAMMARAVVLSLDILKILQQRAKIGRV
ncbi:MAG: hypothetical protein ABW131_05770 [Candidatus Sedimenticola sp. 6PFRAG5]